MSYEFELDTVKFRQNALKLKQALKAEAILVQAGLPALFAGYALQEGAPPTEALTQLVVGLERLGELVDIFAARCDHDRTGEGAWVALAPFVDGVFERRNALLLAWLVECITWQFADFFDGSGLRLVAGPVGALISRLTSTGGSGA